MKGNIMFLIISFGLIFLIIAYGAWKSYVEEKEKELREKNFKEALDKLDSSFRTENFYNKL